MANVLRSRIADRPFLAFVALVAVGAAVYAGFQFFVDGRVDPLASGLFAVVFAAVTVTFTYVRQRLAG